MTRVKYAATFLLLRRRGDHRATIYEVCVGAVKILVCVYSM